MSNARSHKPVYSGHSFLFNASVLAMILILALGFWGRGKGYRTYAVRLLHQTPHKLLKTSPSVACGQPADLDDNILPEAAIAAYLNLPSGKIDPATLNEQSVRLVRSSDGVIIPTHYELTNNGYKLSLHPTQTLTGGTNYTFSITCNLHDLAGNAIRPWAIAFTTKAAGAAVDPLVKFQPKRLKITAGHGYTALRVGPDHRLYAATDEGQIIRYAIEPDGMLSSPVVIESLRKVWGPRIIIGFCFEPGSTADDLAIWVTHNEPVLEHAMPYGGAVSRLNGTALEKVRDVVINLPRSYRDHMTNQPAFGPDGALYICQGSNTAYGAPDQTWANRAEKLFSATVLRLDVSPLPAEPIDAEQLETADGYDPYDSSNALSIFATGIRNAYSLVWHSNGHLYVPTNGSSAGGNTPAGGGVPSIANVPFSEDDFLFDVHQGNYYGHPNPVQQHYVLHGGNPLGQQGEQRVAQYPPGTNPDPLWEPAAYKFGKHVSANGAIEYHGPAFQGHLDHRLLVCRYNLGSDIVALDVASDGKVTGGTPVPGLRSLACPLDLAEDPATGNVYVSEYGAKRIMLGLAEPSHCP